MIQAARNAALVAVAFLAVATLLFLAGLAALVAVGLALAIVMPGSAAALVVAGMLAGLAAAGSAAAVVVKPSIRRRSTSRERPPSRSPAEVEADLADAHYRLDAEIDGLTRRADGDGAGRLSRAAAGRTILAESGPQLSRPAMPARDGTARKTFVITLVALLTIVAAIALWKLGSSSRCSFLAS